MNTSLPKLEEMTDILDLKDMVLWDLGWLWALLISLGVLGLFFLVRFLWKRPPKARAEVAVPQTPLERALEKLDRLEASGMLQSGQVQRFYFALSELFREFIEGEMGIKACEETYEELSAQLKASSELKAEEIQEALRLLSLAEWVKFAKHTPQRQEISDNVQSSRRWMIRVAEKRRRAMELQPREATT